VEPSGMNVIRIAFTKKVHCCTRWSIIDPIRTARARMDNGGISLACTDEGWLITTFFPTSSVCHTTMQVHIYYKFISKNYIFTTLLFKQHIQTMGNTDEFDKSTSI